MDDCDPVLTGRLLDCGAIVLDAEGKNGIPVGRVPGWLLVAVGVLETGSVGAELWLKDAEDEGVVTAEFDGEG